MRQPRKIYCVKQPQWYVSGKTSNRGKHKCDLQCVQMIEQVLNDKKDKFRRLSHVPGTMSRSHSSYLIPLQLGFGRILNPNGTCHYQAPCGRTLHTYGEIFEFLQKTNHYLTVDQFVLDPLIPLFRAHDPLKAWYYLPDISRGVETLAVQVINEHEPTLVPPFEYISELRFKSDHESDVQSHLLNKISQTLTREKVCCECVDDCENVDTCACRSKNKFGYEYLRLNQSSPYTIHECGIGCKCKNTCLNRVVQHGIKVRLQVFFSKHRGWCVRTLQDLVKGTFVCAFVGQVITTDQWIEHNSDSTYAFDLNLNDFLCPDVSVKQLFEQHLQQMINKKQSMHLSDSSSSEYLSDASSVSDVDTSSDAECSDASGDQPAPPTVQNANVLDDSELTQLMPNVDPKEYKQNVYVCDAQHASNVSRFLSYGCNPNLIIQHVIMHKPEEKRVPAIAFFTSKHVKAFSELTWDYGAPENPHMFGFKCKCRSSNCCGK